MTMASTYWANGTGRDTYISRDPVVHVGVTEATPRAEIKNPPGLTPRPPSSMARGSKAVGYSGFLPGRPEGIGKNFGQLSETKDLKNLIPKLRLKHRYVQPPEKGSVTSREYGAFFKNEESNENTADNTKPKTERTVTLPRIEKSKPYTGYGNPAEMQSAYWQQHRVGGPASPRGQQRSTTQDTDIGYSRANCEMMPKQSRQIMGLMNVPQGYTGYRPRFRYCHEQDDANRHQSR